MKQQRLNELFDNALNIIMALEHHADDNLKSEIDALFNEVRYSDEVDSEMDLIQHNSMTDPDLEAQDWNTFGKNKI